VIRAIAGRELRAAFYSPLAWSLLGANQVVLAWVFLQVVERFNGLEAAERASGFTLDLSLNLYSFAAILVLFSAPVIAARMFSSEFRNGVHDLLGSAPVTLFSILLGKYLALVALTSALILLPALNTLLLIGSVELDSGLLAAATLGLWCAGLMFGAVGLFASSLSEQPGVSMLVGYGILLFLSIIGNAADWTGGHTTLFDWLSWNEHLFWFLLGAVRISDVVYFALFTVFFLALTHRRLANRRLQ